jgi:hypothetical protein
VVAKYPSLGVVRGPKKMVFKWTLFASKRTLDQVFPVMGYSFQ